MVKTGNENVEICTCPSHHITMPQWCRSLGFIYSCKSIFFHTLS